jgi:hypothetical protein
LATRDTEALKNVFGTLRKNRGELEKLKKEIADCQKVRIYTIKNYL